MTIEDPPVVEDSDVELMQKLADGDDIALNNLIDRWGSRVAAFLFKMTGQYETSVDLTQETFIKLYQARSRYQPSSGFSTYLFSIASNLAKNHARWKARHPTVSMDATQDDGSAAIPERVDPCQTPEEAAQSAEKIRTIHQAFLRLPADLREAMSLFVYEGMSYTEIASVSQCSVKAVETRIYRARQLLKEQLKVLRP
ncbi:MAG: RNA polymerase sigma factor [Gloeobacteraceae cyanobacterium ES-bin-144]|nr:RNA polymerase sigma factor [Verrucomicrobiales bacterium]